MQLIACADTAAAHHAWYPLLWCYEFIHAVMCCLRQQVEQHDNDLKRVVVSSCAAANCVFANGKCMVRGEGEYAPSIGQ